ncbi:Metallo-dependent phosphatase-like protein [Amylocystis lapponica]|nr:Metallo-dependent phosphatase-like protein [Amylocystis lapponica]
MQLLFSLLVAAASVLAHAGEHDHAHEKRLYPQTRLTPPSRPLEWSDVNIIHTTDSHGWLLGHQHKSFPEPNYSGDFGDFASFVAHMKEIALEKDVDLLLIDTGDLHDGTGLSDGYPAGQVDGHETNKFIRELPYDVMSIGNHELYVYADTYDMYTNFAPYLHGRYLSSNVNITVFDEHGNNVSVPVGSRYKKFTTRKGRRVTSLGIIFDFTGNDVNTTVQPVEDMVKEQWFAEAIAEEPDFFLLIGHMPVRNDHWPAVYNAVRAIHPLTPILIFGGHSHIRDCLTRSAIRRRSMALESGRYMETVGWMSAKLDVHEHENVTFTRRYLDPNRITYEYHTTKNNFTFDTPLGRQITEGLEQLSYWDPYPSNGSILTLFVAEAMPYALTINNSRISIPNLMFVNGGELRFDVLAGPFTKNDQLTSAPFTDSFLYIPNITLGVATQVLPALDGGGWPDRREQHAARETEQYARGDVGMRYNAWLEEMHRRAVAHGRRAQENLTLGYVTSDTCPGVGDDTPHTPMPYYAVPNYIQSNVPDVAEDTPIDLVFVNFIQSDVLQILNRVQSETKFSDADVQTYSPLLANAILGLYAEKYWN